MTGRNLDIVGGRSQEPSTIDNESGSVEVSSGRGSEHQASTANLGPETRSSTRLAPPTHERRTDIPLGDVLGGFLHGQPEVSLFVGSQPRMKETCNQHRVLSHESVGRRTWTDGVDPNLEWHESSGHQASQVLLCSSASFPMCVPRCIVMERETYRQPWIDRTRTRIRID